VRRGNTGTFSVDLLGPASSVMKVMITRRATGGSPFASCVLRPITMLGPAGRIPAADPIEDLGTSARPPATRCGGTMVQVSRSFVVTGGGRGVGRAIVERLVRDGNSVAVLELDGSALDWLDAHAERARLAGVVGSASDVASANAAVFPDAGLDTRGPEEVLETINLNLAPAVVGCATAVRRF
jgi:hypothetical protein